MSHFSAGTDLTYGPATAAAAQRGKSNIRAQKTDGKACDLRNIKAKDR